VDPIWPARIEVRGHPRRDVPGDGVLAGCGGKTPSSGGADDQSAQFQRQGLDITFRYPAALKEPTT
jgi:hypothetical protein